MEKLRPVIALKSNKKIEFCSFSSGSSGNCYLIKSAGTAILVDAGISGKKTLEGLEKAGVETDSVKAILLTHGHDDHVKSLHVLAKKIPHAKIYSTAGTWNTLTKFDDHTRHINISQREELVIGDINVRAFPISHDAEEGVGYTFKKEGRQVSIVTDTGEISSEIFEQIKDADVLAIEANHEVEVLKVSHYPYFLKRRILSNKGHLSNLACGECISEIVKYDRKPRTILLAHLSKDCNTPAHALLTVRNHLEEADMLEHIHLDVIVRNEMSKVY